jgi:hypothetical protein
MAVVKEVGGGMPESDPSYRLYLESRLNLADAHHKEVMATLVEILREAKATNGQVLVLREQVPEDLKERLAKVEERMSPVQAAGFTGAVNVLLGALAKFFGWV